MAPALGSALSQLAQDFHQDSQIATEIDVAADIPDLSIEQGMALYHIAHEALSNARRDAHPGKVSVSLQSAEGRLLLTVSDDGAGFNPDDRVSEEHRGRRNMASRARGIGAHLALQSAPGRGTTVRLELISDAFASKAYPAST